MQANNLAYDLPENLGIPSQAVQEFLRTVEKLRLPLHSFMLLRHGKVAAEGYWPPFDENRKHRMYSVSKSFTSVAVGMMIDEGKLKLSDRVASFFSQYIPENPHRYTMEATVEDLLRMATCNESTSYTSTSPDYVETFFNNTQPKHKPGAFFAYDTAGTTVLCAIVEKLAGKPMLEYMRPVLDTIGFSEDATCIETPEGRSWAGSGILCTPRDLARFALLCLNQGAWRGQQLVSPGYMRAATSFQIDNSIARHTSGPAQGYGYQFWMLREGGFACLGMGSQFAFCMPKYDAILVTTGDAQGITNAEDDLLTAYYALLAQTSNGPLPANTAAQAALHEQIAALALPQPIGAPASPRAAEFSGKTYHFEENRHGFRWLRTELSGNECVLHYENQSGAHELKFGMGHYTPQLFPEKYSGARAGVKDRHYQCIGAAAWEQPNILLATLYAVDDYLGSLHMQLTFYPDELCVFMSKTAERFFDDYQGFLTGYLQG